VVKASQGNVRDLPRSQLGVDVDNGYTPKYITIRGRGPILQDLRKTSKQVDRVYLATDPDREGEAISWHLAHALDLDQNDEIRIEFNEITKQAVQAALKQPRQIDQRLVDAQQARRVLDRLVGYKLSPLLWAKVRKGLSAGRVQSVAVRLICDREAEIEQFVPEEYWTIAAFLAREDGQKFQAQLRRKAGKKFEIKNETTANQVLADLEKAEYIVTSVQTRQRQRKPSAPFITSTLQQDASTKLGFGAQKTMRIAQQLYEGLDIGTAGTVGLITYIRTDSTRVADQAQSEAADLIRSLYGKEYAPSRPPVYKSRATAQGAHEAIRPTSVQRLPDEVKEHLTRDQYRLYKLIWERFVASQMAPAVLDMMSVDIEAFDYMFRATGSTVRFPGFTKARSDYTFKEELLPDLAKGEKVRCQKLKPEQHFTNPPPRYSEAMLVKTMEELGIGRPSTYAQITQTIQKRGYVVFEDKRFVPTDLGQVVVALLTEHFPDIVDVEFTANMEEKLDAIELNQEDWTKVIDEFYQPFDETLQKAMSSIEQIEIPDEVTDEVCENCGKNMVVKHGRFGPFLACPGFPECRNTKPILEEVGVDCPKCGGQVVKRRSKKGRLFYGCSNYPECDFTSWVEPTGEKCPKCGEFMVKRQQKGNSYVICSNKECKYRP
jgi:DNA topoisomerase-1